MNFWVPPIASSGLMIYNGDLFPQWKGDAFVGGLALQLLAHVDLGDDGKSVSGEEKLSRGIGRVRGVREGPDGAIYLAVAVRGIVRLAPANQPFDVAEKSPLRWVFLFTGLRRADAGTSQ